MNFAPGLIIFFFVIWEDEKRNSVNSFLYFFFIYNYFSMTIKRGNETEAENDEKKFSRKKKHAQEKKTNGMKLDGLR